MNPQDIDAANEFNRLHDEAFQIINIALHLEEAGNFTEALPEYQRGLISLNRALNLGERQLKDYEDIQSKVQKMKSTRMELLLKVADVKNDDYFRPPSPPPTYEDVVNQTSPSDLSKLETYNDLSQALQKLKINIGANTAEIILIVESVKVFFISPNGTVKSTMEPDQLIIAQLIDEINGNPKYYLQIGNWIYPLIPDVSPCYHSKYGSIILPDITSEEEGSTIGLIIPDDAEDVILELLEDILHGVQGPPKPDKRARRVRREEPSALSQNIVRGAHYISYGLIRGAQKAGSLLNQGTPKLMDHIQPESQPSQVNPNVATGLRVAKNVTSGAVQVTGYLASKIGGATVALGRYLAPHVQKQGTRLLSSTFLMNERQAEERMRTVLDVTAGAVEGFSTVYRGLEDSAGILASSLADNSVKVIEYKYGSQVGTAAGDTFNTVGNLFNTTQNMNVFTPKGIIKSSAKHAGKGIIEGYRVSLQQQGDYTVPEFQAGPSTK